MAEIQIAQIGAGEYEVNIVETTSSTRHTVTLQPGDLEAYGHGSNAEELVRASFQFLLDREPKEAILASFELSVISRYFPEYQERLVDYL